MSKSRTKRQNQELAQQKQQFHEATQATACFLNITVICFLMIPLQKQGSQVTEVQIGQVGKNTKQKGNCQCECHLANKQGRIFFIMDLRSKFILINYRSSALSLDACIQLHFKQIIVLCFQTKFWYWENLPNYSILLLILIQMNSRKHLEQTQEEDDTLDLLRQFLPEIEAQLKAEIQQRLRQEAEAIAATQLQKIQIQFQQEYDKVLVEISTKFGQIEAEKKAAATKQIAALQMELEQRKKSKLATAQEQLMLQKFDTDIMSHPKLQAVAQKLEEETAQLLLEKYRTNRARKEKELKVRIENRFQRQRNQIEESIRKQVTAKSGLAELREQLKNLRVQLASQKSKVNVKIRSIITQTNEIQKKIQQHEQQNLDKIISELQVEIDQLKQHKQRTAKMDISEQVSEIQNHNHLILPRKQATQRQDLNRITKEHNYIHQEVSFDSSGITQSQQEQGYEQVSSNKSDSILPEPPQPPMNTYRMPKQQWNIEKSKATVPFFKFNIQGMIKQEWQDDEFDKFMLSQLEKQNSSSSSNNQKEDQNSFNVRYKQHLETLNNKGTNKKKVKLSQKAKEQLLQNWSQQTSRY